MKFALLCALVSAVCANLVNMFEPRTNQSLELRELMAHVSFVDMPDGVGGTVRTLRISGLNVQVVNGLGATETVNGAGNLIVGYNQGDPWNECSGSHNLVVGWAHSYTSCGGVVFGFENRITEREATVLGGHTNLAAGEFSTISGGVGGAALGRVSSVGGGIGRAALDEGDWVAGSLWEDQ